MVNEPSVFKPLKFYYINFVIFQLSVDMSEIQFGTTVIDETLKRTFTLTNRGALGTKFDFFKVTGG